MSQSGFEAEYATLKQAAARVEESRDMLRGGQGSFAQEVSLENAINYPFGGSGEEGPITLLPATLDAFTKSEYEPLTNKLEAHLLKTANRLDSLAHSLRQSIAEYERRDRSALDELNRTQPPR